jgi:HK97 family phage major capsid protein
MGKAAALREEAIAKFKSADDLVSGEDGPKAEDQERFDTLFSEGQGLMKQYQEQSAREGQVISVREALSDMAGGVKGGNPIPFSGREIQMDPNAGKSLGDMFVGSAEYGDLKASGALDSDTSGRSFKTSFQPESKAATDIVGTTVGGPAAGLVTPQYLPGVASLPQRPLSIRDLFAQGTTNSDTISYAQQSAFDNAAAAVAQATSPTTGLKSQSSIGWTRKTSPVETIATWMAVTRQALADAGQIRAIIDNQLRLMLQLEEEDQLLNGNGTSPNLSGLYAQTGVQTLALATATSTGDVNLDGVRNAMRLVRTGLSRSTADAIVVHPTDSMEFDLLVDGNGAYRIGDPFAYNANGQPRPIWGLRRVESEAVTAGRALIGAFRVGATVLERQGITILTADQHSDFFVRNLVVILAEERLGFPVYFPTAFVDVTLKAWA